MKIQLPEVIPETVKTQADHFWNASSPKQHNSLDTDDLDEFVNEVQKLNGMEPDNKDADVTADNLGLGYWDIVRVVVEGVPGYYE